MQARFSVDRTLGKLVKWLRILGYDTLSEPGIADPEFIGRAAREGRIALTRKRRWGGTGVPEGVVVLTADRVRSQVGEVLERLDLHPDPAGRLTRCLRCNSPLEEAGREEITALVPLYVPQRYDRFFRCPACGGVYWPGTHRQRIEEEIRRRNLDRHP
jgi:hypothetical protein